MRAHRVDVLLHGTGPALVCAALCCCGAEPARDASGREIPWTYGPTKGGATQEHLIGTGTSGDQAIAKGWKCRLDGGRLTVKPYVLAQTHPLFGKVVVVVGLFDKSGKQLATLRSDTIDAQNATFSFDIDEAVAAKLWDVVFWFAKA